MISAPTAHDCERLTHIALTAKAHWGYPADWLSLWKDDLTVRPQDLLEAQFFKLENPELVGFCALERLSSTRCDLLHMWVLPSYMGQGVGRQLLTHGILWAREQGFKELEIVSDPQAQGFYEKIGAQYINEVPSQPEGRTLPRLILPL